MRLVPYIACSYAEASHALKVWFVLVQLVPLHVRHVTLYYP